MKQLSIVLAALTVAGSALALPRTASQMPNSRQRAERLTVENFANRTSDITLNGRHTMVGKALPGALKARTRADEEPVVIEDTPEGTLATYSRSGSAIMVFWGYLMPTTQDGMAFQVVTAPDNKTVYIQDPISSALALTWMKGTKEGNKISIPVGQYILYDDEEGYGIQLFPGKYSPEIEDGEEYVNYVVDESITEITYTIGDDGTISLDEPFKSDADGMYEMPETILTAFYSDDNSWAGYADWNSVYTPFSDTVTLLPEDVETENYILSYRFLDAYAEEFTDTRAMTKIGFKGNNAYLAGVNPAEPQACVVGTVEGNKIVFPGHQYVGLDYGYLNYFEAATYKINWLEDELGKYMELEYTDAGKMEFAYDAAANTLTAPAESAVLYMAGSFDNPMFATNGQLVEPSYSKFIEVVATPADPEILQFDDAFDLYGECGLQCDIPLSDTEGNFIDPEKLFYIIYIRIDGEDMPYVFYSDDYPGIVGEEMTEVPYLLDAYGYDGYTAIGQGGAYIAFYETAADAYGVQSVYYGGGERKESNIAWYEVIDDSGVKNVSAGNCKVSAIYGIDGTRRAATVNGINIIRMSDGSVRKVMVGK